MKHLDKSKIVIENKKGSYKSFETEDDPVQSDYPLKGVTYPVDYGYIEGYKSEDDEDLDIFIGSGDRHGMIKVWRLDVPIETKFISNVTEKEYEEIIKEFNPVLRDKKLFVNEIEFINALEEYKR